MRFALLLFAVFASLAAGCGKTTPATPANTGPDVASDRDRLQGVWAIESFEMTDAMKPSEEERQRIRIVIEGDKLRIGDKERGTHEKFSFVLDTTKNPKQMTLTELDDKDKPRRRMTTNHGEGELQLEHWIYKFDGELLVFAIREGDSDSAPTEFKADPGTPSRGATKRKGGTEKFERGTPPTIVIRLKKVNETAPPDKKRERFATAAAYGTKK